MPPKKPMNDNQDSRATTHQVNVNAQGRSVVWRTNLQPPTGWRCIAMEGTRSEFNACLHKLAADAMPIPLLVADTQTLDTR